MNQEQQKQEFFDISSSLTLIREKWYIFAISIAICLVGTLYYIRTHSPEYTVKATLLITQEEGERGGSMSSLAAIFGSSANVDDELFAVSSHTVYRNTAQELGLNEVHITKQGFLRWEFQYENYPLTIVTPPEFCDTVSTSLNFRISVDKKEKADIKVKARRHTIAELEDATLPAVIETPYGAFTIIKTDDFPTGEPVKMKIAVRSYDAAAEGLAKNIDMDIASRKSNVIFMEMLSTNIDYAKAVLNTIITNYNQRGITEKNLHNRQTLEFIDGRLEILTDELSNSEASVEKYKKDNGIVDIKSDAAYQFSKKGQLEKELVAAELEVEVLGLVKNFISNPENKYELVPATIIGGASSTGMDSYLNAYNTVILERIDLLQEANPGNMALNSIDKKIDAMRANLVNSVNKTFEGAQVKARELRNEVNATSGMLGAIPTQERQFRDIVRQQTIKEQLYLYLLKQREQTAMLLANSQNKGFPIDEAYAETEPNGISNIIKLALALILGILLGGAYLYIKKLMRTRFETVGELEKLTTVPMLGEVSISRTGETLVVKPGGSTSVAELFRLIRTNLSFMLRNDMKVVMLTSSSSGEGKTFISINLASSLALIKKKVVLIGLDIRRPKLQEYLGLKDNPGFTEYISSNRYTLDDIIIRDALIPGMDIITAGPIPPNPAELLASDKVDAMFADLRKRYDYIIMDTAPIGMVSDTLSIARVADSTIYVCRVNYTTLANVKYFTSLYNEKRLPNMALVVNGTPAKKSYGYGENTDKQK